MSRSESHQIGDRVETHVCERFGFDHLDDDRVDVPDATDRSGRSVEIKAARLQIASGEGTRSGRFYLRQRAHEALVEDGGDYALVVYQLDEDDDVEVLAIAVVPAETIDPLIGSWTPVDRAGEQAVAKIAHTSIPVLPSGVN